MDFWSGKASELAEPAGDVLEAMQVLLDSPVMELPPLFPDCS